MRSMKFRSPTNRMKSFEEASVKPALIETLSNMGITTPTPVQSAAIPVALSGEDLIAVAQTGSGKTLAFALPILNALEKNPAVRALVLTPTREMAVQIQKVFEGLFVGTELTLAIAIGGVPGAKQTTKLNRRPRLLIATPGRLNDHLMTNKLLLQNVEIVVLDEADRMLDMGFAPQLKMVQATMRGPRQTLMFSASFDKSIEGIAKLFMTGEINVIRTENSEAPVQSLKQKVLFLGPEQKHDRLLDEVNAVQTGAIIVFCGSQHSCEDVADYLKSYGVKVDLIHGGLSQGHRNRVVREFREGKLRVVVATDVLARGLDVEGVECVINFDLPFQAEDFLHRIGRTARAGRSGVAITFVTESDDRTFAKIKKYLEDAEEIMVDPEDNHLAEPRLVAKPNRKDRTDKYKSKSGINKNAKSGRRPTSSSAKAKAKGRGDSRSSRR